MQEILGVSVLSLFDPTSRNATVNGSAVDILDYEGQAAAILQSAAGTGTNPTLNVKLTFLFAASFLGGTLAPATRAIANHPLFLIPFPPLF